MENHDSGAPGVLPSQVLSDLVDSGRLAAAQGETAIDRAEQLQPASIDLRLGKVAYRLQSSFLPQSGTVIEKMEDLVMYEVDLDKGGILERETVYLIPLMESLDLQGLGLRGKTNPKSSTGRLDVFTRVITDYSARFEDIAEDYCGRLYLEVVPRSFTIKVKSGMRLNQLRLFESGSEPVTSDLPDLYTEKKLLYGDDGFIDRDFHLRPDGLLMSVDLASSSSGPVGYKAKKNSHVIDLANIDFYDEEDYWERIMPPKKGRVILEPEEFYIFASKERIRVPLDCAAEMVEFDAGSGELRTHYAGFFDPGFGYGREGEVKGTKAVLEVRPHDVPFIIEDGQILFKMKYERMTGVPGIWYGLEIGSNYHDQTLRLAKQFRQNLD